MIFDLLGKAGPGLLPGNENGTVLGSPGSGGEVGAGITYDDVTMVLSINVAWGFDNGFTNLTGNASMGHIHVPTVSVGTASFNENAGILFFLDSGPAWNPSAAAGGVTGHTVTLTEPQEADLLAGKYYINIHTAANGGGEIRGNLVVVPEPSSVLLAFAGLSVFGLRRRHRGR